VPCSCAILKDMLWLGGQENCKKDHVAAVRLRYKKNWLRCGGAKVLPFVDGGGLIARGKAGERKEREREILGHGRGSKVAA